MLLVYNDTLKNLSIIIILLRQIIIEYIAQ